MAIFIHHDHNVVSTRNRFLSFKAFRNKPLYFGTKTQYSTYAWMCLSCVSESSALCLSLPLPTICAFSWRHTLCLLLEWRAETLVIGCSPQLSPPSFSPHCGHPPNTISSTMAVINFKFVVLVMQLDATQDSVLPNLLYSDLEPSVKCFDVFFFFLLSALCSMYCKCHQCISWWQVHNKSMAVGNVVSVHCVWSSWGSCVIEINSPNCLPPNGDKLWCSAFPLCA